MRTLTAIFLLVALTSGAGAMNTNIASGDPVTRAMLEDYYLALRERYAAARVPWVDGYTVETFGSVQRTNWWADICDADNTNRVSLRRSVLTGLDARLVAITPYYVAHWIGGGTDPVTDNLDAWFKSTSAGSPTMATPASVLQHIGAGWSDGTNGGPTAIWDSGKGKPLPQWTAAQSNDHYVIAEFCVSTNDAWLSWSRALPTALYHYDWAAPRIWRADSNDLAIPAGSVRLEGRVIAPSKKTAGVGSYGTNELVSLPAPLEYQALTAQWDLLGSVTNVSAGTVTQVAVFAIGYLQPFRLYGWSDGYYMPWSTIPAASLIERYRYVDALRWTWRDDAIFTNYSQRSAFSELGVGNGCAEMSADLSSEWGASLWGDGGSFLYAGVDWLICTQNVSQAYEYRVAAGVSCAATAEVWAVETSLGTASNTITATAAIYAKFLGDLGDGSAFMTFADTAPADGALVRLAEADITTSEMPAPVDVGRVGDEPQDAYGCDSAYESTCGPGVNFGWLLRPDLGGAIVRWDFQYTIE